MRLTEKGLLIHNATRNNDVSSILIEHEWEGHKMNTGYESELEYDHPPICIGKAQMTPTCSSNGCYWAYECLNGAVVIEDEL